METVLINKEHYPVFIDRNQEDVIRLSWNTDEDTGEKYPFFLFNPEYDSPLLDLDSIMESLVEEFEALDKPKKPKNKSQYFKRLLEHNIVV